MSEEIKGQIEWLSDLRDALQAGETQLAIDTIDAALNMLTASRSCDGVVDYEGLPF